MEVERKVECSLRNAIHRVTSIDYGPVCMDKYTASIDWYTTHGHTLHSEQSTLSLISLRLRLRLTQTPRLTTPQKSHAATRNPGQTFGIADPAIPTYPSSTVHLVSQCSWASPTSTWTDWTAPRCLCGGVPWVGEAHSSGANR